ILPAPVCVKPERDGVTWPCRAPIVMETGGGAAAGAWAAARGANVATASRQASRVWRSISPPWLSNSPAHDHVGGGGEQAVFVLEWARFGVVVVAQFRAKDHILARAERQPGG